MFLLIASIANSICKKGIEYRYITQRSGDSKRYKIQSRQHGALWIGGWRNGRAYMAGVDDMYIEHQTYEEEDEVIKDISKRNLWMEELAKETKWE